MHTFDLEACPIKLHHINTDSDNLDSAMEAAFYDYNCGRAAILIVTMLKEQGTAVCPAGEFRSFTLYEFEEYCRNRKLMPFEYNPTHKKGLDRLLEFGYITEVGMGSGMYVVSLELVARCFGYSPDPSIITSEVVACSV